MGRILAHRDRKMVFNPSVFFVIGIDLQAVWCKNYADDSCCHRANDHLHRPIRKLL